MTRYEKHSSGAFYSLDTLGKLPQLIGKKYLSGDFFISRYEVSILSRHPGYGVGDVVGLYVCDEMFAKREISCLCIRIG